MKYLFILCCFFLSFSAYSRNATYEKLYEVNKCWGEQTDISYARLNDIHAVTENDWIAAHLAMVEQILRARNVSGLSDAQKQNRLSSLDHLHEYWQRGQFPVNEDYNFRTPVFIDKHDNFCAVGYLIKASGNEHISRMIAAHTNLAYVREMKYTELDVWAHDNGFTVDELAWIQPGYPPHGSYLPIAGGVDGNVYELCADDTGGRLYAGGSFVHADSTIVVNNIAYATQSGGIYTWHTMDSGVNGPVHAIIKYGNRIFVGGTFTMAGSIAADDVACWNGTVWTSAGCLSGVVNCFAVFRDTLYAAGHFNTCNTATNENFAWWDGSNWHAIPGITGTVNKLLVRDSILIIGGAFTYGVSDTNIVRWNKTAGFMPFGNNIINEVKDLVIYRDSLLAACKYTSHTDSTNLLQVLRGNVWGSYDVTYLNLFPPSSPGPLGFYALCAEPTGLNIGGEFHGIYGMSYFGNFVSTVPRPFFSIIGAINKLTLFNGDLIAGGDFKYGIIKRDTIYLGVALQGSHVNCDIYPNPSSVGSAITIKSDIKMTHYIIRDLTGKVVANGDIDKSAPAHIRVPVVVPGLYFVDMSDDNGMHVMKKLMIQ